MTFSITDDELESYKETRCIHCKGDYKHMCHDCDGLSDSVVEDCIKANFKNKDEFLNDIAY